MINSHRRQSNIPKSLADKLQAAKASQRMRGERRVITMLFCDVTGSTSMAEQLDPEEWAEIMNEAFDYLITPIYRYEGTLARMMGDGILAFFGAPIAHEDDPQRAIRAGLDIVEGVEPFRNEIFEDYGLDFNVRVVINTGPVVVGEIGSDLALEYTAMGDAINLAARMEETAAPGTVQISSYTYLLVEPLFNVEPLGNIELKGKDKPIKSYRAIGPKSIPGRIRGIEGLEAPLIGREQEFDALLGMMNDLDNGSGGIVFLIGEAGLGRSRLIGELHEKLGIHNGDGAKWRESQGIPYESSRPYSMFQRHMRASLGIGPEDSPEVIEKKIGDTADRFPTEERELIVQAIDGVLALGEAGESQLESAEALKRQLFSVALKIWRDDANRDAIVAVFDDLHWADASSVELLAHLFQLVTDSPVLFICATRPDLDTPFWNTRKAAEQRFGDQLLEINLTPLTISESDDLVNNLLTVSELPDDLRLLISSKSDGNPFYVEEVIRTLIDSGSVVRDESGNSWKATGPIEELSIPDNVQSLLISRIDRLGKQSKRTLQLASVIGRSFYERVLANIANRIEDLSGELETLQKVDLIMESARTPELEYMFRHELTRDAAYHTILHRERRRFHRRVGEALELLMADQIGEEAHRLAYHFGEARDKERALKYYILAGDQAASIFANDEALKHYGKAQELALTSGTPKQLVHLCSRKGRVLEVRGQYDDAIDVYQELGRLGEERNERALTLAALISRATVHSTYTSRFNPTLGEQLSLEALDLAEALGDQAAMAKIYWVLMLVNIFGLYRAEEALLYGEKSLTLAREYDFREQLAYTLHDLSRPYMFSGRHEDAINGLEEAGEIFREVGNLSMLADNRATLSYGYSLMGRLGEGLVLIDEAQRINRALGNYWGISYSLVTLGMIRFAMGQFSDALIALEDSQTIAREGNFSGPLTYAPITMAAVYSYIGDSNKGIETIKAGLNNARESGQDRGRVDLSIELARLLLEIGKSEEAAATLEGIEPYIGTIGATPSSQPSFAIVKHLISINEKNYEIAISEIEPFLYDLRGWNLKFYLLEALLIAGRAYRKLERLGEAENRLLEGFSMAEESGMVIRRLPIALELAKIAAERSRSNERARFTEIARKDVEYISEHIRDPGLRDLFLNREELREIG